MPGPVIIEPQNTGDAPLSYQLAAGQTLEVLAVAAEFDGTNAAGSFVPAVGFYAADGRRLARCPAPTTVAAGASSEVSFFPFAPPASGGGGSAVTATSEVCVIDNGAGPGQDIALADGTGVDIIWTHFSGATLLDYTNARTPAVLTTGIYSLELYAYLSFSPNPTPGGFLLFAPISNGITDAFFNQVTMSYPKTTPTPPFPASGSLGIRVVDAASAWTAGATFELAISNYDGGGVTNHFSTGARITLLSG